jgi:hypothetical protein
MNNTDPWREREFKEEKCYNNEVSQQRISWGLFKNNRLKKKKKKLLCTFVCLSLGLKKLGDFTVCKGHGYPLV